MTNGTIQLETGAVNQPRTLFKPGSWLSKIDFINHLILFNNVLITVLSEKEGGKTSFSTLLQNNLDQQIKSIAMTAKAPCDRQEMINHIAAQLHLNNDAQTNIQSIVSQVNERKAHVLLIIDDAQHVPESLIKEAMLAIKNQGEFGFFHMCMMSDYSVVATLNNLANEHFNNLIHSIELGVLNESETRTYVLQRAMNARLINRPLSDVQFKQFYQLTKGNLAKINSSLEPFILKCSEQQKSNKMQLLKRTGIAASAAIIAGASYLYFKGGFSLDQFPEIAQLTASAPIKNILGDIPAAAQREQLASFIASWQDSSTRQLVHYALPKKQILDDMFDEEDNINTVAIVDKVVVIPTVKRTRETLVQAQPDVAVVPASSETTLVQIPKLAQPAEAKEVKVAKAPVVKKAHGNLYTIQLVASHRVSDVHRFRQSNKLFANAKVRHFTNAKGTWYILTLGEFDSRAKAQSKAKALPADLAKLNPWIRPVTAGLSNIG
ncbi:SPOR domain-containing protein [Legionella shakespearei]|uniref:DamX-related protein n=1 Tax=Legionella shakespearei DSM 23087 TaxID=1122169 RepID=A0A0W0YLY7_9GAMM|nr:SPOR domain-containing protein [Legionella shakespearei]KTD57929.1 DamX-related protein [Legionella shakespearei DSM 23087]